MDVHIAQPLGYSEPGGRSNNEDSIYPEPHAASTGQKWFLVCDGVGGAERGEVASRLAVTGLDAFFRQWPVAVATDEYIQKAVAYVESQFDAYLLENPQASGMATTMTALYIHEAGATVAHIGDSRVYQVRGGSVIWCTDDHSYVNELVKAGVLTPKEAHHHPQRNIITRALQGGGKSVHASVQIINDLRPGDYFFLCSDGVLERISDTLLEGTLWSRTESNEQKLAKLRGYSSGATRDNFTAYLIQIDQVTGTVAPQYQVVPPVYERVVTETDTDESITLINVPIPNAVKPAPAPEPVPAPVPDEILAVREPVSARPEPVAAVAAAPRPAPVEPESDTRRRRTPLPARRSSGPWSVVLLALLGVLIGAGGIIAWQRFFDKPAAADHRQNTGLESTPPAGKPQPSVAVVPPSLGPADGPSDEATGDAPAGESPDQTDAQRRDTQSAGLSIDAPERKPASTGAPETSPDYQPVRSLGNHLSVVKDLKTNLLGLRKDDGQWPASMKYTEISDFKKGLADVKTDRGPEKYITKTGRKFKAKSDYKDGVATLTGVDGPDYYLSMNGNLLDVVKAPSNKMIAVRREKLWGYLDMYGRLAIDTRYDEAGPFGTDGRARVTQKGRTFFIGRNGIEKKDTAGSKSVEKTGQKKSPLADKG